MRFRFDNSKLQHLYEVGGQGSSSYPIEIVGQFMKVMQLIRTATDERDLRAFKSRRFEKLHRGDFSMRLNDQFRLVFVVIEGEIVIKGIEDYH